MYLGLSRFGDESRYQSVTASEAALATKIGIALGSALLSSIATMVVNARQNRRRDRGVLAQTSGMLRIVKQHLCAVYEEQIALSVVQLGALVGLNEIAFGLDTATALRAFGKDVDKLYDAMSKLHIAIEQLKNLQTEWESTYAMIQQGRFHQSGPARGAAMKARVFAQIREADSAIDAALQILRDPRTRT